MKRSDLSEWLFDHIQNAMFLVDVEHETDGMAFSFIRGNEPCEREFGLSNEEFAGRTPYELFDEEVADELTSNYRRCVESRDTICYVEELGLPTSSRTWRTTLTPLVENEQVETILGVARDVSDEVKEHRDITFYSEAINSNPDDLASVDPETAHKDLVLVNPDTADIVDVTQSTAEKLGYSKQELLSKRVHDISPEIGEQIDWDNYVDKIKEDGPLTFETKHIGKDGSTRPVELNVDHVVLQGLARIVATARDITKRKRVEKKKIKFEKAVEAAGHGVMMTDSEGWIEYVNPALEMMSGYKASELIGRTPRVFQSSEHDEKFFENLWETITSGEIWRGELTNRHKSGELYTVLQTISPVIDEDGKLTSFIAVQEDITEKKQREQELKRKTLAIDESPIGITITDARKEDNPICYANDRFLRITGYRRQEIIGRNCRFLQGDDTDPDVVKRIRQAIDQQEPVEMNIRNYRADGDLFWNHLIITPIRNDEGEVTHFAGYQQEITERIETEESLRSRERLYRTLFEEANEAFLIESMDDRILDANKSACELLEYDAEELIGMSLENLTPPDLLENCGKQGIVEYHLETYGTSLFNWKYLHSAGSRIPVEKSKTPIEYRGQEAVLSCVRDRTELERLRKKDQRRSAVVTQVTHDIRTPLNAVTGMGELLRKTDLSKKQRNYLQTVLNAGRNIERLTSDIMDLNRIERGELVLEPEPFQLQELIYDIISIYSHRIRQKEVILSMEVSDEIPNKLIGDPKRIKQILHNLVDNAIKYTNEGSIEVAVKLADQTDSKVVLQFSVSDTGKGIPESKRKEIFKEHEQVKDDPTDPNEGLGLGLSICKNLVEKMCGNIEVESQPGEGTTFSFTIEVQEQEEKKAAGTISLKGVNVLLVDDNPHLRKVLRTLLEERDMEIEECGTGEEAIEIMTGSDRDEFDVVFLDYRLEAKTGEDVLERVTQNQEDFDHDRIYFVTGDSSEKLKDALDDLSYGGILEKPVDEDELIHTVSTVVQTKRRHAEDPDDKSTLQKEISSTRTDSLQILVADDNQNARTLMNEILLPVCEEIISAKNGEGAVKKRFEREPDLILMDIEMPGLDGLEATERIRQRENKLGISAIPIITQTAKPMKHVREKSREAGATKFLEKPINQEKLFQVLRDVLEQSKTNNQDDPSV